MSGTNKKPDYPCGKSRPLNKTPFTFKPWTLSAVISNNGILDNFFKTISKSLDYNENQEKEMVDLSGDL